MSDSSILDEFYVLRDCPRRPSRIQLARPGRIAFFLRRTFPNDFPILFADITTEEEFESLHKKLNAFIINGTDPIPASSLERPVVSPKC